MSDDLKNRGPADRSRISLTEPWEVAYWTKELAVTEARLRQAIAGAGSHGAVAVREWLKTH